MYQQIGIFLVLLLCAGVACIIMGWKDRRDPTAPTRRRRRRSSSRIPRSTQILLVVGFAAGIVVSSLSGWLFTLFLVPALLVGLPYLLGRPEAEQQISRLAAMDEWARNLSSSMKAGSGIEHTIISTPIPEALREEITAFISRLRNNVPPVDAITRFASDLNDSVGDKICGALLLSMQLRGVGLAAVLEGLAEDVGDMVARRRRTEADRKSSRTQAKWVTIIAITTLAAAFLFTNFMEPYKSGGMQIVLLILLTLFAADLYWMKQATKPPTYPRFIGTNDRVNRTDLVGAQR
ncbi:type II secretion system F family protein [Rhodococcus koreensis]